MVVAFALSLQGVVGSTEAQEQLVKGLQSGGVNPGGLVVDPDSVTVSGKIQRRCSYMSVSSPDRPTQARRLLVLCSVCAVI